MRHFACLIALCAVCFAADDSSAPSLTIYNQNFAVVRQEIPLELKAGVTSVRFTDITMHLEPDSVILRDPSGKRPVQVLEQNYRADPISESLLLSLYEGKTIDFLVQRGDKQEVVPGKIIRSGYVPHNSWAMSRYGQQYYQGQMAYAQGEQPIIEIEGKVRFGLPGTPIFPALADDTILKPTLQWLLASDKAGPLRAEFSYVTGGFSWEADYNIVAPEKGDAVDVIGWVTMDNQSGKNFESARIKLMAGDVNKIQPGQEYDRAYRVAMATSVNGGMARRQSPRRRSMNITSTLLRVPQRCTTARPSRWNLSARRTSRPSSFTSTTERRSIPTAMAAGTWKTSATTRSMAPNQTLRFGSCGNS